MANRVFLSYAREDEHHARRLYDGLRARSVDVWFDRVHLKPGRWRPQILRAITQSRFFVAGLSRAALQQLEASSPGFQDTELTTAYQIALDQSEDRFTIVPVRFEDTDRGDHRLSTFQQYDLFRDFDAVVGTLAVSFGGRSTPGAEALPQPAPDGDAELARAIYGKAGLLYATRNFNKALVLMHSVEELVGPSAATLHDRAATLHALGRFQDALETVDKALQMREDLALVWVTKGKILASSGRPDDARASFERALLLDPANQAALFGIGNALFKLDRPEEAANALARLVNLDPANARAYAALGLVFGQMKREEDALRASQKAVELDPAIPVAHETIGIVLVRRNRCPEALPYLDKAIALGSRSAAVHSAKGVALMDGQRWMEAAQSFDEALRINPNHPQASRCKKILIPLLESGANPRPAE